MSMKKEYTSPIEFQNSTRKTHSRKSCQIHLLCTCICVNQIQHSWCGRSLISLLPNYSNLQIQEARCLQSRYECYSEIVHLVGTWHFLCDFWEGLCCVWRFWRRNHIIRSRIFASSLHCIRYYCELRISSMMYVPSLIFSIKHRIFCWQLEMD